MSDYGDLIQQSFGAANPALPQVVGNADEDPERAQRAMDLARATGVPSTAIFGDLDEFERQHKAVMASDIVGGNPHLADFVQSNPIVPKVANDDYGNLDNVSQKVQGMSLPLRALRAPERLAGMLFDGDPLRRWKEGGPLGSWLTDEDLKNHPVASAVAAGLGTPIELLMRGFSGTVETGADVAANLGTAVGAPGAGREAAALVEAEGMGLTGRGHPLEPALDTYRRVAPWIENGREPPSTALPQYDAYRAKQNATDLEALNDATSAAQQSVLRERNPDLFSQFISQHTDAEIGVSGEAVAALYGDKVPAPDDGLLGWVPGIEDKLAVAQATGDDVSVPLADWLTHAEPEVMKALHDDIRVRPNGVTAREAQVGAEQAAANPTEPLPDLVPQTRAAAGLEPSFSVGDRKLELQRLAGAEGSQFGPEQGFHDFSINDEQGHPVGTINLSEAKGGKQLYVEMINGVNGLGPRDFGPALMRSLLQQLKQEFPNAETITGHRVSGAREKAGTYMAPSATPIVKLDVGDSDGLRLQPVVRPDGLIRYGIMDPGGSEVGHVVVGEKNGGKTLHIFNVKATGKDAALDYNQMPNSLGPRQIRGLLGQLKQFHPNAEEITGYRISGARQAAGVEDEAVKTPVIRIDNPKGWDTAGGMEDWRRVLEGGQWESFSPRIQAYIKPAFERHDQDVQLINAVQQELGRIVPHKVTAAPADRIVATGVAGVNEPVEPNGVYIPARDAYPIILYSLESADPLGTARHEAIHHLRQYGFFNDQEWSTLEQASRDNGWIDRFDIKGRYPTGTNRLHLEESIADAYKHWEAGRLDVGPEAQGIFEKMKAFFQVLRDHFARILGKEPTWEDIFQSVSTGEVGQREGREFGSRGPSMASIPGEPQGGSRVFERAAALGMTADQFRRYDELIQQRHAEDIEEATKRATDQQAREQTKQWREDRKALRQEVASDIKQRPDVAADLFLGAGELYGKKVPLGSVKLDASALTPEQKAGLPRNYYGEHGLHPDDVANLFGYGSGNAMLDHLTAYNAAKLQAGGMSAKDFVGRVTDVETDRQMRIKYGVLDDNIVDAVKEQVSGEVQQNLLHEETVAWGLKAGQAPLDKATVVQQLRDAFAKMPLGSVSSDGYMRAAGKAGRQAELSLLAEDPEGAFRAKQQQYYATVIANEAAKLERDISKFDRTAKRFSKREVPSIDQQYTNFIHDILLRVGRPVRRSVQDLQAEIEAGEYKDLQSFVEGKQGFYLREVAVADLLFDPGFRKKFEDLTVDEFRAVDTSIKSLVANGRDEKKIYKAGVAEDLNEVKGQMINQLAQFQERQYDAKGGRWMGPIPPRVAKVLRTYGVAHIQMESLFNRWDHDNPRGTFQQYIMRDLVDASNNESAMEKRFAARLRDLDDKADLKASVDNPLFKVPKTDQLIPMTRGNLRAVLLNAGNDSNLSKMARGWNIPKEQLLAWIHQHATKEDWDWAQRMGDIFADLKKEADTMYRNLSGVAPEAIPISPITTPHGQYPGWYYPLIAHPEFEGGVRKMMGKDALEQEGFVRATTANGYTKARTGAAYPLALDLDMLPARMKQMIHDIAMRPAVINASKIFYDKDIRSTVFTRFGGEWRDMMIPYLVDVANSANYIPKDQRLLANASEFMRQNLISTLVGFNPGTVLKHGPTALVQSLHEVGPANFLKAMKGLFSINERTGETNWQFAMGTSEELQRRHQNYVETLGGATELLQPKSGFASLRSTVQRFAASPVAISDLLSAVPTWLAQYEKSVGEGQTHGDAVYDADRAVRRAHGSMAITNRSAVMRGGALAQWMTSVYGFFNHIMNRQYELLWKSGEALDLAKSGEYRAAMQRAPELTSMLFAYALAPALIEEAVTPLASTDNESWARKAAKGLAYTLGASWVGIRDVANGILNGKDPAIGLLQTQAKALTDFTRDLGKQGPFSRAHAGKVVRDGSTLLGALTGVVPAQVGRAAQFGTNLATGEDKPKGPWGWLTGLRYGTIQGHPRTFQEWQRHHLR